MKIAIIDDSEIDRYLARRIVESELGEVEIVEYPSASAALELLSVANDEEHIVVLLDINMPRMSGFDFLDALPQVPGECLLSFVMLTSSNARTDRDTAGQYRCVKAYVEKPLTREAFRDIVTKLAS